MRIEHLWENNLEDIILGYKKDNDEYCCLFCDEKYTIGKIYQKNNELLDAYGSIKEHINNTHGSVCKELFKLKHGLFGLSEVQLKVLSMINNGDTDKEISQALVITQSTVRNHRFKLREKEKQAKLLLGLMASVKSEKPIAETDKGIISEVHSAANMIDLRYNITDKDREKVLKNYFDEFGALKQFPPKAKKKIIILREIMKVFKSDVEYSEKDINMHIKRIYDDYVTIRRSLIEYGYLTRTRDGKIYKVTE